MLTLSIVARLPLAMFSIGLLVHAQRLTGSFAAAGLLTAAYAVALGVGGPLLGRVVDRRGQTLVLLSAASASAVLLAAIALLPAGAPLGVLVALAAGIGFATPPVGACLRTLLRDPAAFAVEASAVELTWVFGPPLALGAGALFSTGAALAGAGLVLLVSTAAFAAHPVSRAWRPAARVARPRGGSLRSPAMQTLALVLLAVGVLFGAVEIGVAAASETLGATAAAGPLLGVWGVGSLAGGALAARAARRDARPRGAAAARAAAPLRASATAPLRIAVARALAPLRGASRLTALLVALTAAHLVLAAAAGSVYALAAALFLAGAAIAPTYATVFSLVERSAPAGTVTEAFAWLATAVAVGAAVGAAGAGAIAEYAGPAAVFVFAGGAGACALLATLTRAATVAPCQTS
jgi:MFS family permease